MLSELNLEMQLSVLKLKFNQVIKWANPKMKLSELN